MKIRHVLFDDASTMVEFDSIESLESATRETVAGRYVKICPLVPSEERESYRGSEYASRFRDWGALSVVSSPRFVRRQASVSERSSSAEKVCPRGILNVLSRTVPPKYREEVRRIIEDALDEVGL